MAGLQEKSERPSVAEVRGFYDAVNRQLSGSAVGDYAVFLNFGYVPNGNEEQARVRPPRHALNRNCIRLVLEVIGDCPLSPSTSVLDVGCGRGGSIGVLRQYFDAGRIVGLDLSVAALAFARRRLDSRFLAADAQDLPFRSAAFDVVLNLESSHCYPDPARFYREVHRLLRPGGRFLYADLLPVASLAEARSSLMDLGFDLEREIDITSNVLLSCDEIAQVHARAFGDRGAPWDPEGFVAAPGSAAYDVMKNGEQKYVSYKLRKRGGPS
jgi:phthiocerol/phenolphthiocerol synthesis type-I polyketide synthase E